MTVASLGLIGANTIPSAEASPRGLVEQSDKEESVRRIVTVDPFQSVKKTSPIYTNLAVSLIQLF